MEDGKREKTGGRKEGTPNKSTNEVKELLDKHIDFELVVKKLLELVEGVEVRERVGKQLVTYTKPPDSYAAKILLEYRFGKPHQSIQVNAQITEVSISKEVISKPLKVIDITPPTSLPAANESNAKA